MSEVELQGLLASRPDDYLALCAFALSCQQKGNLQLARRSYEAAERVAPPSRELAHNLGVVCRQLGDVSGARRCFERALSIDPAFLASLVELALLCQENGDLLGALGCYERALRIEPRHARSYVGIGLAFSDAGWEADAIKSYLSALEIDPENPEAMNGLAVIYKRQGRYPEAIELFEQALRLAPEDSALLCNLAMSLGSLGRLGEEEAIYRKILARDPADATAHFGLACVLLISGRFVDGWREYEWRFSPHQAGNAVLGPATGLPRWLGEPVDRTTSGLIIYAEQGFGDNIQFGRFIRLAAERFGRVRLQTRKSLLRLFQRSFCDVAEVVDEVTDESGFSHHCPIMSLPFALATTLATLPRAVPYLALSVVGRSVWQARMAGEKRMKVGIAWATGKRGMHKPNFEPSAEDLAFLFSASAVCWVSLSKEAPSAALKTELERHCVQDWTGSLTDFDDTAALIGALDLVISVDTAVAHLTGALGKPVWLLKRAENDWCWFRDREDAPLYPTMRLFRQQQNRQWRPVVNAVSEALSVLSGKA